MPRRNTPDHSYFDSVSTQLELRVGRSCSGVVSNVESNTASGIFPGLNVVDTGLKAGMAYHRFRYYSPETGAYISQDPIRLGVVQTNLYVYLHDVNIWVDPLGLVKTPTKILQQNKCRYVGAKHIHSDIHHGFPEEFSDSFKKIAGIDVNTPKYYYNLLKYKHTTILGVHTNSSRIGKNWNKTCSGILDKVVSMNLSQNDAKDFLEATPRELAREERISKY